MATWQFDLHLVPRPYAIREFDRAATQIRQDQFHDVDWWAKSNVDADELRRLFSFLLPNTSSWSAQIEKWGTEDGDRIDLVLSEGGIADVFIRVDVRQLSKSFISGIAELAKSFDCVLLSADLEFLEPDEETINSSIENSRAAQFVADPERFLRGKTKNRN